MIAPPPSRVSTPQRIAYSVDEVAKATGLGRTTLYSFIKQGRLPVVKLGKRTLIRNDDLQRFLTPEPVRPEAVALPALSDAAAPIMSATEREAALKTIEKTLEPIPQRIGFSNDHSLYTEAVRERRARAEAILTQREQGRTN